MIRTPVVVAACAGILLGVAIASCVYGAWGGVPWWCVVAVVSLAVVVVAGTRRMPVRVFACACVFGVARFMVASTGGDDSLASALHESPVDIGGTS